MIFEATFATISSIKKQGAPCSSIYALPLRLISHALSRQGASVKRHTWANFVSLIRRPSPSFEGHQNAARSFLLGPRAEDIKISQSRLPRPYANPLGALIQCLNLDTRAHSARPSNIPSLVLVASTHAQWHWCQIPIFVISCLCGSLSANPTQRRLTTARSCLLWQTY